MSEKKIQDAVEALSATWLGRGNVCSVHDESRDGRLVIVLGVAAPLPQEAYPSRFRGFPVVIESAEPFTAQ